MQQARCGGCDPERAVSAQPDAQPLRREDEARARKLGVEHALVRGRHRLGRRRRAGLLRALLLTSRVDDARNLSVRIEKRSPHEPNWRHSKPQGQSGAPATAMSRSQPTACGGVTQSRPHPGGDLEALGRSRRCRCGCLSRPPCYGGRWGVAPSTGSRCRSLVIEASEIEGDAECRVPSRGQGGQTEPDLRERLVRARVLHQREERVTHVGGGSAGAEQRSLARPQHAKDAAYEATRDSVDCDVYQGGPRCERYPRLGGEVEAITAGSATEHAADNPDERLLRLLQPLRLVLRVVRDAAGGQW